MMKIIDAINLIDTVGTFTIMTSDVMVKGQYLTLVLKDRVPFDMEVSSSVENARKTHASMIDSAHMTNALLGLMEAQEAAFAPLPDRSVLN